MKLFYYFEIIQHALIISAYDIDKGNVNLNYKAGENEYNRTPNLLTVVETQKKGESEEQRNHFYK